MFPDPHGLRCEHLLGLAEQGGQDADTRSPEQKASVVGFLGFAWFTPLVDLALQRNLEGSKLETGDLHRLADVDRAQLQLQRLQGEWDVELAKQRPSVQSALRRAFGAEVAATGCIKLCYDLVHFVNPYLLGRLLRLVATGEGSGGEFLLAAAMVVVSFAEAFLQAHYFRRAYRSGMRVRSALILLIYCKGLRALPWESHRPPQGHPPGPQRPEVGPSAAGEPPGARSAAPGQEPGGGAEGRGWAERARGSQVQLANLMSTDTDKFTNLMPLINLVWSAPLQLAICLSLLFTCVSWAAFAGGGFMALIMAASTTLQRRARKVQVATMQAKDLRLRFQTQVFKVVRIIKLYAWELAIEGRIKELRDAELRAQLRYMLWNIGNFVSWQLSPSLVSLVTFAFYAGALGRELTAPIAFTSVSLFFALNAPFSQLPLLTRAITESSVAAERIQCYLLAPEVPPAPREPSPGIALELCAPSLCWPNGCEFLRGVDLQIRAGEFVVIAGKTGAGKSGLLYAVLGELPLADGGVASLGPIGYCSQAPWLRNASIRENITGVADLGGNAGVANLRYNAILEACCLVEDLRVLPQGSETLVGDRGINLSGGQKQRVALARAVYADPPLLVLDDVLSALDSHVAAHLCKYLFRGPLLEGKTVVLVTHSRRALAVADRVVALDAGCVAFDGSLLEFLSSGVLQEPDVVREDEAPAPLFAGPAVETLCGDKVSRRAAEQGEERGRGAVAPSVYRAYMKAGGMVPVTMYFLSLAGMEGSKNAADGWLAHWSDHGHAQGITIYASLSLLVVVAGLTFVFCRISVGQAASRHLHEQCQHVLLRASMSFYDRTPMGRILNRLSEDTSILDSTLPLVSQQNLTSAWRATAIVVMCTLVGWYVLAAMLPMLYLYSRRMRRYLPAMRDLRRLDAATRSPMLQHFTETVSGCTTLRAMRLQAASFALKSEKLERQMQAQYLSTIAPRWLSLRNQLNGAVLVGIVATVVAALSSKGRLRAGIAGLAITYVLRLTDSLNMLNQTAADRETQFISVERLHEYISGGVEQEAALSLPCDDVGGEGWPRHGRIVLQDVTARYRPSLPAVLNGLSLEIRGGERVGIVGRTGSGKSTLLATLLRLVEPERGQMSIDGVDIRAIGLHALRAKVCVIPQEPTILMGTARFNLDPAGVAGDEELWAALEKSQMRLRIESAGGLGSRVEEGGSNFSLGEMQLLCLAGALLRRRRLPSGGLLILDEATSSLDVVTDQRIQHVLREEFQCTTITIAHRIDTLLDYDRVVVLDAGRVVEFDTPAVLLSQASCFQALAREAGCVMTAGVEQLGL